MGNLEFDDGRAGDLAHVVGEIGDGVTHAGVPGAVTAALAHSTRARHSLPAIVCASQFFNNSTRMQFAS